MYCPPGFMDGEDGSGNHIDGGWRQDEESNSGMQSISPTGSNRCIVYYHYSIIHGRFYAGTLGQLPRLETYIEVTSALHQAKLLGNTIINRTS